MYRTIELIMILQEALNDSIMLKIERKNKKVNTSQSTKSWVMAVQKYLIIYKL